MTKRKMTKRKTRKKRPPRTPPETGDCYAAAFRHAGPGDIICHGVAIGTGGEVEGKRFGHAWVERRIGAEELVFDTANGLRVCATKADYYAAGSIDPETVHRYTWDEAATEARKTGHSGPWRDLPPGVL